jgi:hypothetical protein
LHVHGFLSSILQTFSASTSVDKSGERAYTLIYCSIGSHLQKIFRNFHTVAQFGGGKDVPVISLIGGTASQLKVMC